MRYSMLVHLCQMCGTLKEAAAYLQNHRRGALSDTLRSQGGDMLAGIGKILRDNPEDVPERILKGHGELTAAWAGDSLDPKALDGFAASLVQGVRYRVRAVFFAELGEKWDAMDSVYQFMRQDPRFDPVVVLMPIFRQIEGEDGTTKQETIYRDYLTPLGIPFLGYDQYSLPDDLPDLAFTSQPYNGAQLPQFSAEYVSKYTRLVYLPYFVPDKVYSDAVHNWCQLPIYEYAWKVIGSSERHYQLYRDTSLRRGSNMLVTGVPKLDPAVALRAQGAPLPEKWRDVIRDRRVVLWNSWYDIVGNSLRYFEQILSWFQEHPECALIWRPHPMSNVVTKLYYPEKYDFWIQCRQRLNALPNAVQDEEVSCSAAFYYSHAMISDFSSLMPQYLFQDKPCLWMLSSFWSFNAEVIDGDWTEQAADIQDVLDFLDRVKHGRDPKARRREEVRRKDLPLADGHSGARVCEEVWSRLHMEDGIIRDGGACGAIS